jgi:hypothetical protein
LSGGGGTVASGVGELGTGVGAGAGALDAGVAGEVEMPDNACVGLLVSAPPEPQPVSTVAETSAEKIATAGLFQNCVIGFISIGFFSWK